MDINYDIRSIESLFTIVNEFLYNTPSKNLIINVDISTTDGINRKLKLSNNKANTVEVYKNIIVYNKMAISLKEIIKLKISTENINDNLKKMLYTKIKNIILSKPKVSQMKNTVVARKYNYKTEEYNMEDYIQKNYNNITKISYNGINTNNKMKNIEDEVLDILKNNLNEVEVAKPIQTNKMEVVRDLDILQYDIIANPTKTNAVEDIKENISKAVTTLETKYINGVLGNINEKQILKSNKVNILEIEPINKFIDKKELDGKELRVDPTYERYIGVVLDDGTFEPLKIKLNTYNVLQNDTLNYVGNIDADNHLNKLVSEVNEFTKDFVENIKVEYEDNLVQYKDTLNIKDMINIYKEEINNVLNSDDTTYVTKNNKIQTINSNSISNIDKIEEDIKGSISLVGGGIMIVEDGNNGEITIYSTSKINSVN